MCHIKRLALITYLPIAILAVAGCRRDVSAAENTQSTSVTSAAVAQPAVPQIEDAAFSLVLKATGPYTVGKEGSLEVQLQAKSPHHVNQEYPHKFKLRETEGVTFAKPILTRDSMKIEPMSVSFSVPFTAAHPGDIDVAGEFAFSLCTADRCLIEKRALGTKVHVR